MENQLHTTQQTNNTSQNHSEGFTTFQYFASGFLLFMTIIIVWAANDCTKMNKEYWRERENFIKRFK